MTGFEQVVDALGGDLVDGRYLCPVHGGHALAVDEGDGGTALVHCFAGCSSRDVLKELGLDPKEVWGRAEGRVEAAYYVYVDEEKNPLIRVIRFSPKGFTQERWSDGQWVAGAKGQRMVPYMLPELIAGADPVYVTEGEKDAENLAAQGFTTTTLLGGAGKWLPEYAPFFRSRHVILVGDNDDAGRLHVARLRGALRDARRVDVVYPKVGKDVTDHLLEGYSVAELEPETLDDSDLGPLDWENYMHQKTAWLLAPYVPRGARVLAYGKTGSLKSLWALWLASKLTKQGNKVAYFNLEMRPSDIARRLKQASPDKSNLKVYTSLRFGNEFQIDLIRRLLKGYDLVIVDSWSAAQQGVTNDEVADLDNRVLQPLMDETGATILILDNTGHAVITDKGRIKPDHARGASAKEDKMEVGLLFERPFESDNYRTTITMKKMRLDEPIAPPVEVYTPRDRVEFYKTDDDSPLWAEDDVAEPPEDPLHGLDRVTLAREQDRLGLIDIDAVKEEE
jgi:hypothetical protein